MALLPGNQTFNTDIYEDISYWNHKIWGFSYTGLEWTLGSKSDIIDLSQTCTLLTLQSTTGHMMTEAA